MNTHELGLFEGCCLDRHLLMGIERQEPFAGFENSDLKHPVRMNTPVKSSLYKLELCCFRQLTGCIIDSLGIYVYGHPGT